MTLWPHQPIRNLTVADRKAGSVSLLIHRCSSRSRAAIGSPSGTELLSELTLSSTRNSIGTPAASLDPQRLASLPEKSSFAFTPPETPPSPIPRPPHLGAEGSRHGVRRPRTVHACAACPMMRWHPSG